jgi:hypothetical protein
MTTAAIGAEKFYTTEGNTTRVETPEVAAEIDARIKSNWIGHPYFHVVDNRYVRVHTFVLYCLWFQK